MTQPVVRQSYTLTKYRGMNAGTIIMTCHDNMTHLEDIHRKLHHRQTTQIRMGNDIGDIAMDENIARQHLARIVDHSPARGIAVETAPGDQKLAQYPFKR